MYIFGRLRSAVLLLVVFWLVTAGVTLAKEAVSSKQGMNVLNYTVQSGDSLWSIANRFNVSLQSLAAANNIALDKTLNTGDNVLIPQVSMVEHKVQPGESLWTIANNNSTTINSLIKMNNVVDPNDIQVGDVLYLTKQTVDNSSTGTLTETANVVAFDWPLHGVITSPYGQRRNDFHTGIDIAASEGTNIAAARGGTVVFAGWSNGYGKVVKIDHGDGYDTLYAHTSKILVDVGDKVARGQIIAKVGSTGNSTGPHLHFEVRHGSATVNPLDYLRNSIQVASN